MKASPVPRTDRWKLEATKEAHAFTIPDLRLFSYARKFGETVEPELAEHLASCVNCQEWLKILRRTDPILNGEDEERVQQLVRHAADTAHAVPAALGAAAAVDAGADKV